ncbi:hypothetical protein ABKN59_011905 [Abortiporus biennis]
MAARARSLSFLLPSSLTFVILPPLARRKMICPISSLSPLGSTGDKPVDVSLYDNVLSAYICRTKGLGKDIVLGQ